MRIMTAALLTLAAATPALAQAPAREPGATEQRLAYFVGDWSFEGTAETTPMGPGGPLSSEESCSWYEGGFHVVCEGTSTSPRGEAEFRRITVYDQMRQAYTVYGMNSFGDSFFVPGQVEGKVWTWEDEMDMEGTPMKFRVTLTEESPTRYAYRMEASFGDSPWAVVETGTGTKQE